MMTPRKPFLRTLMIMLLIVIAVLLHRSQAGAQSTIQRVMVNQDQADVIIYGSAAQLQTGIKCRLLIIDDALYSSKDGSVLKAFVSNKETAEFESIMGIFTDAGDSPREQELAQYKLKVWRCGATCLDDQTLQFMDDTGIMYTHDCTQYRTCKQIQSLTAGCVPNKCAVYSPSSGNIYKDINNNLMKKCTTSIPPQDNDINLLHEKDTCTGTLLGDPDSCTFAYCGNTVHDNGEECDSTTSTESAQNKANCDSVCRCKSGNSPNGTGGCIATNCPYNSNAPCIDPKLPYMWWKDVNGIKADCLCHSCPIESPHTWTAGNAGFTPKGFNFVTTILNPTNWVFTIDSNTYTMPSLMVDAAPLSPYCKTCPGILDFSTTLRHYGIDGSGNVILTPVPDGTQCISLAKYSMGSLLTFNPAYYDQATKRTGFGHINEIAAAADIAIYNASPYNAPASIMEAWKPWPPFAGERKIWPDYYEESTMDASFETHWWEKFTGSAYGEYQPTKPVCSTAFLNPEFSSTPDVDKYIYGDINSSWPNGWGNASITCSPCYGSVGRDYTGTKTIYSGAPLWYVGANGLGCYECPPNKKRSSTSECVTPKVCPNPATEFLGTDLDTCCPNGKLFAPNPWYGACDIDCKVMTTTAETTTAELDDNVPKIATVASPTGASCVNAKGDKGSCPPGTTLNQDHTIYVENLNHTSTETVSLSRGCYNFPISTTYSYVYDTGTTSSGSWDTYCGTNSPYLYEEPPVDYGTYTFSRSAFCHNCPKGSIQIPGKGDYWTHYCTRACPAETPYSYNALSGCTLFENPGCVPSCYKCKFGEQEVKLYGDDVRVVTKDQFLTVIVENQRGSIYSTFYMNKLGTYHGSYDFLMFFPLDEAKITALYPAQAAALLPVLRAATPITEPTICSNHALACSSDYGYEFYMSTPSSTGAPEPYGAVLSRDIASCNYDSSCVTRNTTTGECLCPNVAPFKLTNQFKPGVGYVQQCWLCPPEKPYYFNDTNYPPTGGCTTTTDSAHYSNCCHDYKVGQCPTDRACTNVNHSQYPPSGNAQESCKCVCTIQCPVGTWINYATCTCSATDPGSICGNGAIEGTEQCDLAENIAETAKTLLNYTLPNTATIVPSTLYKNECRGDCKVYRRVWCAGLPNGFTWDSNNPSYLEQPINPSGCGTIANNDNAGLSNYLCGNTHTNWTVAPVNVNGSMVTKSVAPVKKGDPGVTTDTHACIYK